MKSRTLAPRFLHADHTHVVTGAGFQPPHTARWQRSEFEGLEKMATDIFCRFLPLRIPVCMFFLGCSAPPRTKPARRRCSIRQYNYFFLDVTASLRLLQQVPQGSPVVSAPAVDERSASAGSVEFGTKSGHQFHVVSRKNPHLSSDISHVRPTAFSFRQPTGR